MEGTCFFDDFPLNWKYKYDQPLSETHFRRSGTQFRFCGVTQTSPKAIAVSSEISTWQIDVMNKDENVY